MVTDRKCPSRAILGGLMLWSLIASGCAETAKAETPFESYSRLSKVRDQLNGVQYKLESQCLRRNGLKPAPVPAKTMVLNVSETQFPSEQLVTYTDLDFAALVPVPPSLETIELLKERNATRKIDGIVFAGGCTQWASEQIHVLFPFSVDIASIDSELSSEVKKSETKDRAQLDAEWQNCLTGQARTTAKSKGYSDPSHLQLAMGGEALQTATQYAADPRKARRLLSLRVELEKVVIGEARRCAEEIGFFKRFDRLRSSSIAKVLDQDKVQVALDFDINQIRFPSNTQP